MPRHQSSDTPRLGLENHVSGEGFFVSGGTQSRSIAFADTHIRWSEDQLLELSSGEPPA
jgi:hypothetical protein